MSERKEPTVSSVLSSKEELMDRRTRSTQKDSGTQSAPSVRATKQSSGFVWLILLIALLAVAVAAYAFLQLQQAQKILAEQDNRIVELEDKLALSDDSATQSLATASAKIRELTEKSSKADSEIAKLWAARKVNKNAIAAHKKSIESLTKSSKEVASLKNNVDTLKKSVDGVSKIKSSVSSLSQSVSDQDILLQSLREKVAVQGQSVKNLSSKANNAATADQVDQLDKRIKGNEEGIRSFDAFRRTVNRDLLQLKQSKK